MADLNATIQFLTPYFSTVEEVVGTISLLVGGIFGIYLISTIMQMVTMRRMLKTYKEIKGELKRLNERMDVLEKRKR